jgi:hypothetical protein
MVVVNTGDKLVVDCNGTVYFRIAIYSYEQYIMKLKGSSSRLNRTESDTIAEASVRTFFAISFFYLKILKAL